MYKILTLFFYCLFKKIHIYFYNKYILHCEGNKKNMEAISVVNLTKDYGLGRGVFEVNLSIEQGEVYGFLGPNGAGKSTTIRHLMGFSKPDSGETKILGKNTFKYYDSILEHVGYLPGEIALPSGLTIKEFLRMMKELRNIKDDTKTKELIEMFELGLNGDLKSMSLGQKRKLAVVTAFMHDPDILILDEPTSGLDPLMQEVFIGYIMEEKKRGKTILLSSHIFSEIDATCDKISIIKDGRIVDEFITNDLKHNAIKVYVIQFSKLHDLEKFVETMDKSGFSETIEKKIESKSCMINVNEIYTNELIEAMFTCNAVDVSEKKISLQEYFMKFYKEDRTYVTV